VGVLNDRFVLRDLSLPTRLTLSLFLMSVGVGYFSALVQLHFAGGAKAGEPLPGPAEVEKSYHGDRDRSRPVSRFEHLLVADSDDFSGQGTMKPAFTTKSRSDWDAFVANIVAQKGEAGKQALLAEREGERKAVIEWIRVGGTQFGDFKKAFEDDKFVLSDTVTDPITADYLDKPEGGHRVVKIKALFEQRCTDCHGADGRSNKARKYPFEDVDKLKKYVEVKAGNTGMSLDKLAQTTHVHLLAFSMLYGLTGFLFSLTTYPALIRYVISPLALFAQLCDISCWWLARANPFFAQVILVTGGVVGLSVAIQILGSLFDMYGGRGKMVLFVIIVAGALGGGWVHQTVIKPYLDSEAAAAVQK
jgi:hypothetical protein